MHVRVYSLNFEELAEFSLEMLVNTHSWGDYLKGVMCEFLNSGYALKGFDAVIGGNVPRGAGLSSSAAIEVATAFF